MKTFCGIAVVALLLALALLPAGIVAAGALPDPTGYDFLESCTAGVRALDGQRADEQALAGAGVCGNYLQGFMDASAAWGPHYVCVPQGMSSEGLMRAVTPWLRTHPARLPYPRRSAVYAALLALYPCPGPPALIPRYPAPGPPVWQWRRPLW